MKLVKLLILALFLPVASVIAQTLNEYKYVIVPAKYDFLKQENQYQLNALTKFLFEKEGFSVVYNNQEMPSELANNNCLGLNADVKNESSLFTTKLIIELTNCKNQKVLISEEGKSKEKDYKAAYHEALRNAFESVKEQNYSFSGPKKMAEEATETPKSVEEVEEIVDEADQEMVELEEVTETVSEKTEVEPAEIAETAENAIKATEIPTAQKLYAQENPLGYQLVDSSPKIAFVLLKSGKKDLYFLKDRSGIFFKEDGKWFAEYYIDGQLVKQEFEVKW